MLIVEYVYLCVCLICAPLIVAITQHRESLPRSVLIPIVGRLRASMNADIAAKSTRTTEQEGSLVNRVMMNRMKAPQRAVLRQEHVSFNSLTLSRGKSLELMPCANDLAPGAQLIDAYRDNESTNSTREKFIAAPMLVAGGWNSRLTERSCGGASRKYSLRPRMFCSQGCEHTDMIVSR